MTKRVRSEERKALSDLPKSDIRDNVAVWGAKVTEDPTSQTSIDGGERALHNASMLGRRRAINVIRKKNYFRRY